MSRNLILSSSVSEALKTVKTASPYSFAEASLIVLDRIPGYTLLRRDSFLAHIAARRGTVKVRWGGKDSFW